MVTKEEKRRLVILAIIVVVVGGGMLLWGQYNTAAQIYDIGVKHVQATELLSSDEAWARSDEEAGIYEAVRKNGENWRLQAEVNRRSGVYAAASANEQYGKAEILELSYDFYDNGSDKTVILLHAYQETPEDAAVFAPFWWDQGFNVLIPSVRGFTESGGKTAFGAYEQYDLLDLIRKENLNAQGSTLVVHGKGIGSASALLLAGNSRYAKEASIDFIVADTVYPNLKDLELKLMKRHFSLGNFIVGMLLDGIVKTGLGFDITDIDIAEAAARCDAPVMFVCAGSDEYLGPDMTKAVYEACTAQKSLTEIEGAGYGMSYAVSKSTDNQYEALLEEWIGKIAA
jgi:hypothetical protein